MFKQKEIDYDIETVEYDGQGLTTIRHLYLYKKAKKLLLPNNFIVDLRFLTPLLTLKSINLSNNGPWPDSTLEVFIGLPRLEELSIDQNGLTSLSHLKCPKLLQYISARGNKLTCIDIPDIEHTNLRTLLLHGNNIQQEEITDILNSVPTILQVDNIYNKNTVKLASPPNKDHPIPELMACSLIDDDIVYNMIRNKLKPVTENMNPEILMEQLTEREVAIDRHLYNLSVGIHCMETDNIKQMDESIAADSFPNHSAASIRMQNIDDLIRSSEYSRSRLLVDVLESII